MHAHSASTSTSTGPTPILINNPTPRHFFPGTPTTTTTTTMATTAGTDTTDTVLMVSLLHLPSTQFSDLRRSLSADLGLQRHRLLSLLLSPSRFSATLSHLRSLSFASKTVLLARLLLRALHHFAVAADPKAPATPSRVAATALKDLDAAVLLMAMCDCYDDGGAGARPPESASRPPVSGEEEEEYWRARISADVLGRVILSPAGLGLGDSLLLEGADAAAKCRRLMGAVAGEEEEEKGGRERAAAVAAVVGLETAEGKGREWCVVCREEMGEGRDLCGMPCGHRFHWGCILPWLRRRNTCPCCRYELPSEDAFGEIGRLWRVVVGQAGKGSVPVQRTG